MNDPSTPSLFPGNELPSTSASPSSASGAHEVAKAMALLWTYRPRTAIYNLLLLVGRKRSDGRAFTQDDVKRALAELPEHHRLEEMPRRDRLDCACTRLAMKFANGAMVPCAEAWSRALKYSGRLSTGMTVQG